MARLCTEKLLGGFGEVVKVGVKLRFSSGFSTTIGEEDEAVE